MSWEDVKAVVANAWSKEEIEPGVFQFVDALNPAQQNRVVQPASRYLLASTTAPTVPYVGPVGARALIVRVNHADMNGNVYSAGNLSHFGGVGIYSNKVLGFGGTGSSYVTLYTVQNLTPWVGKDMWMVINIVDDGGDGRFEVAAGMGAGYVHTTTDTGTSGILTAPADTSFSLVRGANSGTRRKVYKGLIYDRSLTVTELDELFINDQPPADPAAWFEPHDSKTVELLSGANATALNYNEDPLEGNDEANERGYSLQAATGVVIAHKDDFVTPVTEGIAALVFASQYINKGAINLALDGTTGPRRRRYSVDKDRGAFDVDGSQDAFTNPATGNLATELIKHPFGTELPRQSGNWFAYVDAIDGKEKVVQLKAAAGSTDYDLLVAESKINLKPLSLPLLPSGASVAVINKTTGATLDKRVLTNAGYSYSYQHEGSAIDFEVRIAKEGFKPQKLLITAGEGGIVNNVELEPFPLWQTLAAGEGLTTGADVTELTPLPDRVQMTVAQLKAQRVFIFAEWLNTLMDWIDTPYFMALESRGNSKVYFIAIQTILVDVLAGTHGTLIGGLIKNASGIALTHPESVHYLQIDPEEVYEYIPAVGAEGFTTEDRTQLNKGLTADEFAAAV